DGECQGPRGAEGIQLRLQGNRVKDRRPRLFMFLPGIVLAQVHLAKGILLESELPLQLQEPPIRGRGEVAGDPGQVPRLEFEMIQPVRALPPQALDEFLVRQSVARYGAADEGEGEHAAAARTGPWPAHNASSPLTKSPRENWTSAMRLG